MGIRGERNGRRRALGASIPTGRGPKEPTQREETCVTVFAAAKTLGKNESRFELAPRQFILGLFDPLFLKLVSPEEKSAREKKEKKGKIKKHEEEYEKIR